PCGSTSMTPTRIKPYTAYEKIAGARSGMPGSVPSDCRICTTKKSAVAPTTGPQMEPRPPTVAMIRNWIDSTSGNEPGAMKLTKNANSPPASPAYAADNANTCNL